MFRFARLCAKPRGSQLRGIENAKDINEKITKLNEAEKVVILRARCTRCSKKSSIIFTKVLGICISRAIIAIGSRWMALKRLYTAPRDVTGVVLIT